MNYDNYEEILDAIEQSSDDDCIALLTKTSSRLKKDLNCMRSFLRKVPSLISNLPKNIALEILSTQGDLLAHATEILKNDDDYIRAAATHNYSTFSHYSEKREYNEAVRIDYPALEEGIEYNEATMMMMRAPLGDDSDFSSLRKTSSTFFQNSLPLIVNEAVRIDYPALEEGSEAFIEAQKQLDTKPNEGIFTEDPYALTLIDEFLSKDDTGSFEKAAQTLTALSATTLNHKVNTNKKYTGMSIASVLFALSTAAKIILERKALIVNVFTANNDRLLNALTEETINTANDKNSILMDTTIAYNIAKDSIFRSLLRRNNYSFSLKINSQGLNYTMKKGKTIGNSAALALASSPYAMKSSINKKPAFDVLLAHDGRLAQLITQETLNRQNFFGKKLSDELNSDEALGKQILAKIPGKSLLNDTETQTKAIIAADLKSETHNVMPLATPGIQSSPVPLPSFFNPMTIHAPYALKYLDDQERMFSTNSFTKYSLTLLSNSIATDNSCDKVTLTLTKPLEKRTQQITHTPSNNLVINTQCKTPIKKEDRCLFVLAGRQEEALFPAPTNQTRVIAVLTQKEYETLSIPEEYDFLIVPETGKIGSNSSMVTSRRRAVIMSSMESDLNKIIMLDDNISKILIKKPSMSDLEEATDILYDALETQFTTQNQAFLAIQTHSNRSFNVGKNSLMAGKAFMLDINFFRQRCEGEFSKNPFILMPEDDGRGQQDYFLQNIIIALYEAEGSVESFNFAANRQDIELVRSKDNTNLAAKHNDKPSKMELSNAFETLLKACHCIQSAPLIKRAIELQNHQQATANKKRKEDKETLKEMDIIKILSENFNLETTELPPPTNTFSELLQLSINPHKEKILYPHQLNALMFLKDNEDKKKLVFDIATGCGKTRLMALAAFAKLRSEPSKNVAIICPTRFLAEQTKLALRSLCALPGLPKELKIPTGKIHGVYSGMQDTIPKDAFLQNKLLQRYSSIFVFCDESYKSLLESSKNDDHKNAFKNRLSLVINDESHLVDKNMPTNRTPSDTMTLNFSATPAQEAPDVPCHSYTRKEGIEEGILSPLLIDDSLNTPPTLEDIKKIVENCPHPANPDTRLNSHKGIIYVNSIKEAQILTEELRKGANAPNIYEIHSLNKMDASGLDAFKADKQGGIAIAVQLLKEGFDSLEVDWLINAKKPNNDIKSYTQMLGRILRKDPNNPNKIGFAIQSKALTDKIQEEAKRRSPNAMPPIPENNWLAPNGQFKPIIPPICELLPQKKHTPKSTLSSSSKKSLHKNKPKKQNRPDIPQSAPVEMFAVGKKQRPSSSPLASSSRISNNQSLLFHSKSPSKRVSCETPDEVNKKNKTGIELNHDNTPRNFDEISSGFKR